MTTNTNTDNTLTMKIHITTLNINGLHNDNKRTDTFQKVIQTWEK